MSPKMVIAGGTGFLGSILSKYFLGKGYRIVVLTRRPSYTEGSIDYVQWNGRTVGGWVAELEGAHALINLNGKSVDCRYTKKNRSQIYATRIESTDVLGRAIAGCRNPPKIWINASSATIYRHSIDKAMTEEVGEIGTGFSVDVCKKWEAAFSSACTPGTRKVVMRTGLVLGRHGGPLKPLKMLAKIGLGGRHGSGDQYFSWLHENDFLQIVEFFIRREDLSGVFNVTSPNPVPNRKVMRELCRCLQVPVSMPQPVWLLEIGAAIIRTETELILKSRNVIPTRLINAGYKFQFADIESAMYDLCSLP